MSNVMSLAQRLKAAQPQIAHASTEMKNRILLRIADHLCASVEEILEANRTDISSAAQNGIPNVMLDRLSLSEARIHNIADGVRKVARLADPIGEVLAGRTLPNGLKIRKERVPIGVVGMIYESRPNVTVDAAVLCLKASNAVMLRGGKEAICTNMTLTRIMQRALVEEGLNPDILLLVEDTSSCFRNGDDEAKRVFGRFNSARRSGTHPFGCRKCNCSGNRNGRWELSCLYR